MSADLIQAVKNAVKVAEDWIESEARKVEAFMEPVVKEIGGNLANFVEHDLLQIGMAAAKAAKDKQPEDAIVAGALAAVKELAKEQAPELGIIGMHAIAVNLAAHGKALALADPGANVNE